MQGKVCTYPTCRRRRWGNSEQCHIHSDAQQQWIDNIMTTCRTSVPSPSQEQRRTNYPAVQPHLGPISMEASRLCPPHLRRMEISPQSAHPRPELIPPDWHLVRLPGLSPGGFHPPAGQVNAMDHFSSPGLYLQQLTPDQGSSVQGSQPVTAVLDSNPPYLLASMANGQAITGNIPNQTKFCTPSQTLDRAPNGAGDVSMFRLTPGHNQREGATVPVVMSPQEPAGSESGRSHSTDRHLPTSWHSPHAVTSAQYFLQELFASQQMQTGSQMQDSSAEGSSTDRKHQAQSDPGQDDIEHSSFQQQAEKSLLRHDSPQYSSSPLPQHTELQDGVAVDSSIQQRQHAETQEGSVTDHLSTNQQPQHGDAEYTVCLPGRSQFNSEEDVIVVEADEDVFIGEELSRSARKFPERLQGEGEENRSSTVSVSQHQALSVTTAGGDQGHDSDDDDCIVLDLSTERPYGTQTVEQQDVMQAGESDQLLPAEQDSQDRTGGAIQTSAEVDTPKQALSIDQEAEEPSQIMVLETVSLSEQSNSCFTEDAVAKTYHELSAESYYRCGCLKGRCRFRTVLPTQLELHLREDHPYDQIYPCVHCGSQEAGVDSLMSHLEQHLTLQAELFYCSDISCQFRSSPEEVIIHMRACHPNHDHHYMCWLCNGSFDSLVKFSLHVKQNMLSLVRCQHCSAKDVDRQAVLMHMTSSHPGQGRMVAIQKVMICHDRTINHWYTADFNDEPSSCERSEHLVSASTSEQDCSTETKQGMGAILGRVGDVRDRQIFILPMKKRETDTPPAVESNAVGQEVSPSAAVEKVESQSPLSQAGKAVSDRDESMDRAKDGGTQHLLTFTRDTANSSTDRQLEKKTTENWEDTPASVDPTTEGSAEGSMDANTGIVTAGSELTFSKMEDRVRTRYQRKRSSSHLVLPSKKTKTRRSGRSGAIKLSCNLCGIKSTSTSSMQRHTYSHHSDHMICPICSEKGGSDNSLRRHILELHPDQLSIFEQVKSQNFISGIDCEDREEDVASEKQESTSDCGDEVQGPSAAVEKQGSLHEKAESEALVIEAERQRSVNEKNESEVLADETEKQRSVHEREVSEGLAEETVKQETANNDKESEQIEAEDRSEHSPGHVYTVHSPGKRYKQQLLACKLCTFSGHSLSRLRAHVYSEHRQMMKCPKCDECPSNDRKLYWHLSVAHSEEKDTLYQQHRSLCWISEMPTAGDACEQLSCKLCGYFSTQSAAMHEHMYKEHKQAMKCPRCYTQLDSDQQLYDHLLEEHADEKDLLYAQHRSLSWVHIPTGTVESSSHPALLIGSAENSQQDLPAEGKESSAQVARNFEDAGVLPQKANRNQKRGKLLLRRANIFQCKLCSFCEQSKPTMVKHLFVKHKEVQCTACSSTVNSIRRLKNHIERQHPEQKEALYNESKPSNWFQALSSSESLPQQWPKRRRMNSKELVSYSEVDSPLQLKIKKHSPVKQGAVDQSCAEMSASVPLMSAEQSVAFLKVDETKEYRCPHCTSDFKLRYKFYEHLCYHYHYRCFKCAHCPFLAFSGSSVVNHCRKTHKKEPRVDHLAKQTFESRIDRVMQTSFVPVTEPYTERRLKAYERVRLRKLVKKQEDKGATLKKKNNVPQKHKKDHAKKITTLKKKKMTKMKTSTSKRKVRLVTTAADADEESEWLVCPYCRGKKKKLSAIEREIRFHIHYKPFTCPYCKFSSSAESFARKHISLTHPKKDVVVKYERIEKKEARFEELFSRAVELSKPSVKTKVTGNIKKYRKRAERKTAIKTEGLTKAMVTDKNTAHLQPACTLKVLSPHCPFASRDRDEVTSHILANHQDLKLNASASHMKENCHSLMQEDCAGPAETLASCLGEDSLRVPSVVQKAGTSGPPATLKRQRLPEIEITQPLKGAVKLKVLAADSRQHTADRRKWTQTLLSSQ